MAVKDIKEYIDNAIDTAFAQDRAVDTAFILKRALIDTKEMLDELESKSKWEIGGHHRRCEKCGEYFCIDDREGDEIPHNFCGNCGARMEDE